MKKMLLLLLTSLAGFAQSGFETDNKDIVWTKKFDAENANIAAILDRNPELKVGGFMDNMYKGMAEDIQNTCDNGTGIMKNPVKFTFMILTDPYGYVVKVREVKIMEKYGPMQARLMANPIEKYFMDNESGVLKTEGVAQQNMECLDGFLTSLFSPGASQPVTTQPASGTALTSNK